LDKASGSALDSACEGLRAESEWNRGNFAASCVGGGFFIYFKEEHNMARFTNKEGKSYEA